MKRAGTWWWIPVLIGVSVLLSQCAIWFPWERKRERIREAEEQLVMQTDTLVSISPEETPEKYAQQEQAFEAALERYLELTDTPAGEMVVLESGDQIYVLPIRTVASPDGGLRASLRDKPTHIVDYSGSPIAEAPLDIRAWKIHKDGYQLFIVFSDSVGMYELSGDELKFRTAAALTRSEIRSLSPAGRLSYHRARTLLLQHSEISGSRAVGSRDSILFINQVDSTLHSALFSRIVPMHGRGLFNIPNSSLPPFRNIRGLPGSPHLVLVDPAGFLHLTDRDSLSSIWRSDRPWGHRLFLIDSTRIGLINTAERSIALFGYQGKQLDYLGQTADFPGMVHGAAALDDHTILVLVREPGRHSPVYRPLLYNTNSLPPDTERDFARPWIPDYSAELTFLLPPATEFPGYHHSGNTPDLWRHVYETPVKEISSGLRMPLLSKLERQDAGKTWTLTFRDDIQFSDGSHLNAGEIVEGWKNIWNGCLEANCPLQWLWQDIAGFGELPDNQITSIPGIRILDERRIRITFRSPHPHFPLHLTKHPFAVMKSSGNNSAPLGTGPYQAIPSGGSNAEFLRLDRVEGRSGIYPPLASIRLVRNPLTEISPGASRTGGITPWRNEWQYLRKFRNLETNKTQISRIYFLVFNPERPPLSETDVRLGIAGSLDREVTSEIITDRTCVPRTSLTGNDENISSPPTAADIEITRPLRIAYRSSDPVAGQIAERLTVRLDQQGWTHSQPKGISDHSFRQLQTSGRYDILVDAINPVWQSHFYQLIQLSRQGYILPDQIEENFRKAVTMENGPDTNTLEAALLGEGIFYPVLATNAHLIFPDDLSNIRMTDTGVVDFTTAWFSH